MDTNVKAVADSELVDIFLAAWKEHGAAEDWVGILAELHDRHPGVVHYADELADMWTATIKTSGIDAPMRAHARVRRLRRAVVDEERFNLAMSAYFCRWFTLAGFASCPSNTAEPPWISSLPRMLPPVDRLPAPAITYPGGTSTDPVRLRALALRRRCPICGCELPRDHPVYRQWSPGLFKENAQRDVFLSEGMTPQHASCAILSARICPWLKYEHSRGRGVGPRGPMIIAGFRTYGAVLKAIQPEHLTYRYYDPVDMIDCGRDWRDLEDVYERACATDNVDVKTRLHWGADDVDHLANLAAEDEENLKTWWASVQPVDENRICAAIL